MAARERLLYTDPADDWLGEDRMLELTGLRLAPGVEIVDGYSEDLS